MIRQAHFSAMRELLRVPRQPGIIVRRSPDGQFTWTLVYKDIVSGGAGVEPRQTRRADLWARVARHCGCFRSRDPSQSVLAGRVLVVARIRTDDRCWNYHRLVVPAASMTSHDRRSWNVFCPTLQGLWNADRARLLLGMYVPGWVGSRAFRRKPFCQPRRREASGFC